MRTLLLDPFLAVHPAAGAGGWYVICKPGALAALLADLAGEKGYTCTLSIRAADGNSMPEAGEQPAVAIPLTPALDAALVGLVDALIAMRYETGQVQLKLDLRIG